MEVFILDSKNLGIKSTAVGYQDSKDIALEQFVSEMAGITGSIAPEKASLRNDCNRLGGLYCRMHGLRGF